MRKFFLTAIVFFLFLTCSVIGDLKDAEVPASVSVRTAAKFDLPAGDTLISLREKLSVTRLQKILAENIDSDSELPNIYDYNPNQSDDSVLQYIIDYPIAGIPLSPDFDFDNLLSVGEAAAGEFSIVDLGNGGKYDTNDFPTEIPLSSDMNFESAILSEGKIVFEIDKEAPEPPPEGFSFELNIGLYYSSYPITESDFVDCAQGGKLVLDLKDKNLPNSGLSVKFSFRGKSSSNSSPNSYHYTYKLFFQDLKISKITGLDINEFIGEEEKEFNDTIDTGIKFSEMLSSFFENNTELINNVKFSGIAGYLFIQESLGSEALRQFSPAVSIKTKSGEDSGVELIDAGGGVQIKSLRDEGICSLASLADSNRMITTRWTDNANPIFSAKTGDGVLDDIINAHPDDLSFDYSVSLATGAEKLTLTGGDIESLKNGASIDIRLAIVLPFNIILADESDENRDDGIITIEDILDLFGNSFDDDLLDRDDDWDSDDFTKYVDAVESLTFNYVLVNTTPLKAMKLTFCDEDKVLGEGKALKTEPGPGTIEFTPDEITKILESQSFIPKAKMEIEGADGTTIYSFPRNSAFGLKGTISLKMNGAVEIWNKDD